jgi:succinate dehydrogenase/fumarate reductase flavoprotein subunit
MNAYPDSARGKAALESPAESGQTAYLRNSLGERFMERYNKKTMELASQEDLAKAIDTEVKEGRGGPHGGCFLDLRHIPREIVVKSAPGRLEHIERLGYDISKDLIEVYPVVHTTTGGVRINEHCETGVPGLYAAGQVAFAVSDCLGEGATGIVDALFWGKIAGQNAATYSQSKSKIEPEPAQVKKAVDEVLAPLKRQTGPTPLTVIRKLQHVMWENVGIVKNQAGLEKAQSEIIVMRDTLLSTVSTKIKAGRFNLEMLEAVELGHMLVAAEAIIRSSLERKESRNRFHRSDYPAQDDRNWLKHIIITKSTEGMKIALEPVEFPYFKPEVS